MLRTEHAVAGEQQNQAYGIVLCAQWARDLTALETHTQHGSAWLLTCLRHHCWCAQQLRAGRGGSHLPPLEG